MLCYQGDPTDEALFKLIDRGGGLVSFESVVKSSKFQHYYISVKSNGTAGNTKATGMLFSDDIVFQVRVAQLVSVLLE